MNRTRPKQIVIRVSEEELAQIKRKVEQSERANSNISSKHLHSRILSIQTELRNLYQS